LKSGRFLANPIDSVLSSPKAKIIVDHDPLISCEKRQTDVLAAAAVIPSQKKIQISSNSKLSDFKSIPSNAFRQKRPLTKMPNSN
jgi:hypothetical protein